MKNSLPEMTIEEKYKDARNLINQALPIVEVSRTWYDSDKIELKKEWLRKAREVHGAGPVP